MRTPRSQLAHINCICSVNLARVAPAAADQRVKDNDDEKTASAAGITLLVFFLEDVPQLIINSVYINTMTFADADSIAIFAFVMSLMSIVLNMTLFYKELKTMEGGDALSTCGWVWFQLSAWFTNMKASVRDAWKRERRLMRALTFGGLALFLAIAGTGTENMIDITYKRERSSGEIRESNGGYGIWTWGGE